MSQMTLSQKAQVLQSLKNAHYVLANMTRKEADDWEIIALIEAAIERLRGIRPIERIG